MGKKILILAEYNDGNLRKSTLEMITAAHSLDSANVTVLLSGEGCTAVKDQLNGYSVDTLLIAESPDLKNYSLSALSKITADLVGQKGFDLILASAGSHGKEFLPYIAAKLDFAFAADCTEISDEGGMLHVTRPVYAGKALINLELPGNACVSIRPNAFTPVKKGEDPVIEMLELSDLDLKVQLKDLTKKESSRPELTEASIVVSGGRGMGGAEHYPVIEELADQLGAAVGASRAAVDAGWRPHSDQVGQTGKTVSPNLYIACGISGAIQHLAGMSSSKVIVAINKDEEAPIFKIANYGIVGDLFEVVPAFVSELKK